MANQKFEKSLPSDHDLLPQVEEFAFSVAEKVGLDKEKHNDLALALSEAASNSIKHGNKSDKSKTIKLTIIADDEKLIAKSKDQGEGFDPSTVPDPTAPENILKDSGRGIFIINTLAQNLHFEFSDSGTEIIFEFPFQ
ncbi:MAG: ATP-binding protein [Melioribacteraceae bacterium]|nr:ATP-binding protein [Melioribacteraceae bacterium]MCF8266023.1 ATP-binding protein [Melioribacteraceae bacterium]MCF8412247.1 ATP-binding protein [Melioribacteraceae bacterium]